MYYEITFNGYEATEINYLAFIYFYVTIIKMTHIPDQLYLQFRDEHEAVPVVTDFDQLGDLLEARIKPGLSQLLSSVAVGATEYAGYGFTRYLFPMERLDFQFPEVTEGLLRALSPTGDDAAMRERKLLASQQDLHIDMHDCFDVMAFKGEDPEADRLLAQWNEDGDEDDDNAFRSDTFVLGAVVRTYEDEDLPLYCRPHDKYNQRENIQFSLKGAVAMRGEVLLPGLHGLHPHLRHDQYIPMSYIPELLTLMYDLRPKDTTWYNYKIGQKRYMAAHPSYPSGSSKA